MGETTDRLGRELGEVNTGELSDFLNRNWDSYEEQEGETFRSYMECLQKEKGLMWKQIFANAGLDEKFGHELIKGRKRTKKRDVILAICLGMMCSLEETNHALWLYEMAILYPHDVRDVVLIYAIHHRKFRFFEVDELLANESMKPLDLGKAKDEE